MRLRALVADPAPGSGKTRRTFWIAWLLTVPVLLGTIIPTYRHPPVGVVLLSFLGTILCTVALLAWLAPGLGGAELAGKSPFRQPGEEVFRAFCALLFVAWLVSTYAVVPLAILLAILVLALLRPVVTPRRQWLYVLALAAVAGTATLMTPVRLLPSWVYAPITLLNVSLALTAGWALMGRLGLSERSVGQSLFLAEGALSAVRGFGLGALIGMPWALWNIALAPTPDRWVHQWWQPVAALAPGIGEEAWGRVLLISAFAAVLVGWPRVRRPLLVAVLAAGFLFGAVHSTGVGAIIVGVVLGGLYSLPLSYLWLRKGYETAVGFHFVVDFVRLGFSFLTNHHIM